MGATAQHLPPERRAFASGFINAGGSFGQFVFAPLDQAVIGRHRLDARAVDDGRGRTRHRATGLAARRQQGRLPLRVRSRQAAATAPAPAPLSLREQLRIAARDRSYWCLHAGFFTCGFHIAFLVTHLPGEVEPVRPQRPGWAATSLAIIGLANIAGSLTAGALGNRVAHEDAAVLDVCHAGGLAVVVYMALPKTEWTFYVFAAVLGATWLATVPPTAGLTAKLFGTRYLATLFGLTLLSASDRRLLRRLARRHRASGQTGSYAWMWGSTRRWHSPPRW